MVRFARAEGSLGCNKRVLEEPTPWAEMVAQRGDVTLVHASKKRKQDTKDADVVELKKKKKRCKMVDGQEVNVKIGKSKSHKKQKINEIKQSIEYMDSDQHTGTLQSEENSGEKEKQKKKKKENTSASPKVEFVINAKGQRVKVFKDGTERTWFDLPYEENERMTRYDNMWVKKEMVNRLDELKGTLKDQGLGEKEVMRQMMKAKRKAHRELRIELIYEQKRLVNEQQNGGNIMEMATLQETTAKKKDKKKKEKKKSSTRQEVSEMDVDEVSDTDGTEMISRMPSQLETVVKKKKEKKRESGSAKQEVSEMDLDEVNGTDRSEMISEMSRLEETMSEKKVDKKKKNSIEQGLNWVAEGKCNDNERTEMVSQEETLAKVMDKKRKEKKKKCGSVIQGVNDVVDELNDTDKKYVMAIEKSVVQGHNHHEVEEQEQYEKEQDINNSTHDKCLFSSKGHSLFTERDKNLKSNKDMISFDFQEDDLMTNYEGYWVMREGAERLNSAREQKLQAILDSRINGSTAGDLTREENIAFQRAMKKEKRFEHRKLIRELMKQAGGKSQQKRKGIKQKMHADPHLRGNSNKSDRGDIVMFDGFWVKKESADRLTKLREKLRNEGVSEEELKIIIQKERRKEERLLKNERQLVCLKCRKPGHMVSACPELKANDSSAQVDICYTCGSTEHTSRGCTLKKPGSEFSLATCYICGESGHISRQCPDNPRGLYPNGGACRGCGSVEHLARDCPDLKEEQEKVIIKANRMDEKQIEALETQLHPTHHPVLARGK